MGENTVWVESSIYKTVIRPRLLFYELELIGKNGERDARL
jgi:hypothetical protein